MSSGNRLQRKTLNDSQTEKDYQDTSNNDTLYNTIAVGLSIFFGHKLYKSGALKGIAKPFLEIVDSVAKDGTDKASIAMSTIKEWSKLKHMNSAQLSFSNQGWNPSRDSIFRTRNTSFAYDLFEDLKDVSNGSFGFKNMKKCIEENSTYAYYNYIYREKENDK